ncbi:uncharacterized protein LY89DRAFT_750605 [Mollisia scopiformis]|uniref:Uncharacterized protein n=1 Tax=Mollisia scopiformis TaxID=149040 RepID=A0A194X530_MOLSC|nr:uncharacterized protein LY89DRAFT_750605 [Mollisia scopiformis]KUJ15285.1 hypothetical protein LY89DRAFT_750605 [Mollisia scopiformis]
MCYYEQYSMACGDWKWGNFRAHCSKEYRTGETCEMKLVWESIPLSDKCKYCIKIDTKHGKIAKEEARIKKWRNEGPGYRRASIEQAEEAITVMQDEICELNYQRASYKHLVAPTRSTSTSSTAIMKSYVTVPIPETSPSTGTRKRLFSTKR